MNPRLKALGFSDPNVVGSSEYRAIYDCIMDATNDGDGAEFVDAMLVEFEEWAQELRRRIQNSKREASKS